MAALTKIEWTHASWNPVTGCDRVSAGCAHCYAERMAHRLQAMGQAKYVNGFKVTLHPDVLPLPLAWKKPRHIFVNSMSDLFHKDVPLAFIRKVFEIMRVAHWHSFQILTKRSERLASLAPKLAWPDNVWAGVTVESSAYLSRLDDLARVPAAIRFVSMEPLLGPIPKFRADKLDWVILGGESGPGARPMEKAWVKRSATAAVSTIYRSSSSNGAAPTARKPAASSMAASASRCPATSTNRQRYRSTCNNSQTG